MLDVRAEVPETVHFDDLGDQLRLAAKEPMRGFATGRFDRSNITVTIDLDDMYEGVTVLGFAFTQFAMPVIGSRRSAIDFAPTPQLQSPAAMLPALLRRSDGMVCLLAPLDSWHEQIITVDQDDQGVHRLRWGWHGDLDRVEEEFSTTLGIYRGLSATEVFAAWRDELDTAGELVERSDDADPVVSHLSYWTDNGAAYWYRTEPGIDIAGTLEAKLEELEQLGVQVGSVELDSWFYPHEVGRPVVDDGYLPDVPPTGMLEWLPRPDVLPRGFDGLGPRLAAKPLILHSRHISPQSPYLEEGEWWVDWAAHPVDQDFFARWFDSARSWGATCVEQDWMMLAWFGVRQLREVPGRAAEWLNALARHAAEAEMSLIWCMSTPADMIAAAGLDRVCAVRTSDDYRFADDPARLWHWFVTVNRLIDTLGLVAFKDCFFTADLEGATESIDGDEHREVEALLAAMSAGVVGIGDRIGRSDPVIIDRLCRPDGLLAKPDRPLAIADQSIFRDWADSGGICWSTTSSGEWLYVVALHTADTDAAIVDRFDLPSKMLVYDWRTGEASPDMVIDIELGRRDWALFVCCPLEERGGRRRSLIGDASKYATMSRQRVRYDGETGTCLLAAGEAPAKLRWWIEGEGVLDR